MEDIEKRNGNGVISKGLEDIQPRLLVYLRFLDDKTTDDKTTADKPTACTIKAKANKDTATSFIAAPSFY